MASLRKWAKKFVEEMAFVVAVSLGLYYGAHLSVFESVLIAFVVSIHSMVLDIWLEVKNRDDSGV